MMHRSARSVGLVLAISGLAAGAQVAQAATDIDVIFCKKGGHPKAAIPGWVNHAGQPVAVEFRAMNQVYVSPDGGQWMVAAQSTADSNNDIGFVYGSGLTGSALTLDGHTFVEGQPMPQIGGTGGFMDHTGVTSVVSWNDAGDMVFGFSVRPTQTASSNERRIFVWNGSALTLYARTGDSYIGHSTPGALVGTSINNYHILNDGRAGFLDSNSPAPTPSSQRPILSYIPSGGGNPQVLIHNSHPVLDINGSTTVNLTGLSTSQFTTSRNGQYWASAGSVETAISGPAVFIMNNPAGTPVGRVLLKSTTELIPGSNMYPTRSTAGFLDIIVLESGDWFVRGNYATTPESTTTAGQYVMRSGLLIARPGDPITPGSPETWVSIQGIAANNNGDFVIFGRTSEAEEINDVGVLNGEQVILREGDPVSIDGTGVPDAWIGRGNNTLASLGSGQWTLTDDMVLYGVVMLRDGPLGGNDINTTVSPPFGTPQAFIRKTIGSPPCYANCDGSTVEPVLNIDDFTCFINEFATAQSLPPAQQVTHYANCDGSTVPPVLNIDDFTCFINAFAQGCE